MRPFGPAAACATSFWDLSPAITTSPRMPGRRKRAAWFAEPPTSAAIAAMARQLLVVSADRIAKELRNLLLSPHGARGVNLLLELGMAAAILPELLPMKGLPQGPPHEPNGDLWDHVLRVLEL